MRKEINKTHIVILIATIIARIKVLIVKLRDLLVYYNLGAFNMES